MPILLRLGLVIHLLLAASIAASPSFAGQPENQLILRAAPNDVADIARRYGLEIVDEVESANGYSALLEARNFGQAQRALNQLRRDRRVAHLESARVASLADDDGATPSSSELTGDLTRKGVFSTDCLSQHFTAQLWSGYSDQQAAASTRLHEAHALAGGCGEGTVVAVLDTGIDPDHPLFAGALVDGYDFLLDEAGQASEWAGVDQSVIAILEQSVIAILEGPYTAVYNGQGVYRDTDGMGPILEQSVIAILEEQSPPDYFGHGTMVSGLVRLAAPGAHIMPLRVFSGEGTAHVFDLVQAIYWAVDHGADVINMSFSMPESSKELQTAIQYARKRGVVCVTAAGNQAERRRVYPGAWSDTINIAAVSDDGLLADFSNYGSGHVDLAAPGSGVVSAYPGGLYGAGWGTSFSAPLAAGAAAILKTVVPGASTETFQGVLTALFEGSTDLRELSGLIGSGRLDAVGALEAAARLPDNP